MPQIRHRGIVAIVLAAALGVVLIVLVVAVALGVQMSEVGRSAAWAIGGALAGALVTFMTTGTSGNSGTQPPLKTPK